MTSRTLGTRGPRVSALGLACRSLSERSGPGDDAEGLATLHAALDAGVTLLDTGDFYARGANELLIRRALERRSRDRVILAVKFGVLRDARGLVLGSDGRPAAVKSFLAYSLGRLGSEYVDIYRPARVDPAVPIEDTIGAIAELVAAGLVRHVGLSEVGIETLRRAHAVHPIADVQLEYSPLARGVESQLLPVCRQLGIGISALSSPFPDGDRAPQLQTSLQALAVELGASPAQLALAWTLARGYDVVPLMAVERREQLADALGAASLALAPAELARVERALATAAAPAAAVSGDGDSTSTTSA
jgi:aryl-alcohol dehydrogenase-like predicted oxidoreductase